MFWATNLDAEIFEQHNNLINITKSQVFVIKFNYLYKKLLVLRFTADKNVNLYINNMTFMIDKDTTVNIPFNIRTNVLYIQVDNLSDSNKISPNFVVYPFDCQIGIQITSKTDVNIIYSFDNRYYVGFFASLKSFLTSSNTQNLSNTLFNLCIPLSDYDSFMRKYHEFSQKITYTVNKNIVLITKDMIQEDILHTKCYKGGNHLLSIGNFSRLLIGKLFNYELALYLDSDTIIQRDIYPIIKNININENILCGKSSELTYKNIININNIEVLKKSHCTINVDDKIIYTGTILFNCKKFRNCYDDIIKLIQLHNNTKGGIYKLFTMSILNIVLYGKICTFDSYLTNIVDLGCKKNLSDKYLVTADVLDWSGINKPWFTNGYYKNYWDKFNILFKCDELVAIDKNTVENNLSC